jgi:hypothetical protein
MSDPTLAFGHDAAGQLNRNRAKSVVGARDCREDSRDVGIETTNDANHTNDRKRVIFSHAISRSAVQSTVHADNMIFVLMALSPTCFAIVTSGLELH